MGSGLILGLTLSALLYWRIHPEPQQTKTLDIAIHEKQPQPIQKVPSKPKRFDFYAVLAENDANKDPYLAPLPEGKSHTAKIEPTQSAVSIRARLKTPEPEIKTFKPNEPKPFNPNGETMMLQVGSFKSYMEAQKLQEQLAQKGFKASIQTFKMNPQETWYRVTLGPYKNREEALQQQAKLEQTQPIHSLIVKFRV